MAETLEDRVRRIVRVRLARGQRDALAQAAGHQKGTWVTNWLTRRQRHATIDEMDAMLRQLGISLARVIAVSDVDDAIDWEVFGLMGRLSDPQKKRDARDLVAGLIDEAVWIVSRRPSARVDRHPRLEARKSRGRA